MKKILATLICFLVFLSNIPVAGAEEQVQNNDAALSNLTVAGQVYYELVPSFNYETTEYTVNVPNDVTSVDVTAVTADPDATLEIGGEEAACGEVQTINNLEVGDNEVDVKVTAEDGTTVKTYTLTIKRAEGEDPLPQTPAAYAASDYAVYGSKMAAGKMHTAAVKPDGTVAVWGDNTNNQLDLPENLTGVKAVAAGDSHTLALKEDGTLMGWGKGYNSSNQLVSYAETIPAGLTDVKSIAAGSSMSAAVKNDGSVVIWGYNSSVYDGDVLSMSNVAQVAINGKGVVALDNSGTVTGWGIDSDCTNVPEGLEGNVVAVAAGTWHWLALKKDGTVAVWGYEEHISSWKDNFTSLEDVRAIGGGRMLAVALLADGSLDISARNLGATPEGADGVSGCKAVTVGVSSEKNGVSSNLCVMKSDGTVSVYGPNGCGQADVPAGLNLLTESEFESDNAELSSLTVTGYDLAPVFDPGAVEYTVNVPNGVTSADVTAITADPDATLEIGGEEAASGEVQKINNLEVGDNEVDVKVTAEDGITVKTYTLTIKRAEGEDPLPQTPAAYAASDYAKYAAKMAVGKLHAAAVKPDGIVAAWGDNTNGQCEVPEGLTGVKAIAAGSYHTLALKEDGALVGWGKGYDDNTSLVTYTIPAELQGVNVKLIAAGSTMSAAVKEDGGVVVWGYNSYDLSTIPANLGNVVAIAINGRGVVALNDEGKITVWGDTAINVIPAVLNQGDVVAVAAGNLQWMALEKTGKVDLWGNSSHISPCQGITSQADVRAIASGRQLAAALLADGTIICYGNKKPAGYTAYANVMAISTIVEPGGSNASNLLAVQRDGTLLACGPDAGINNMPEGLNLVIMDSDNNNADLSSLTVAGYDLTPEFDAETTAYAVDVPNDVTSVDVTAVTADPNATLKFDGEAAASGVAETIGPLNVGENTVEIVVTAEGGTTSRAYTLTILRMYEANPLPLTASAYQQSDFAAYARSLAAGGGHILAVKKDGTVVAWGNSDHGQGDIPQGLDTVAALAAGYEHSLAIKEDGTVAAWGRNHYGQCDVPGNLEDIADIAAGQNFSAALDKNGRVYVWGENSSGQCDVPEDMNDAGCVVDIACGNTHMLALKADGTVAAWGSNSPQSTVPEGLNNVLAIAASFRYSMALKADGTAVIWGTDNRGNEFDDANIQNVRAVSLGDNFAAAIKWDGTMAVWGDYPNGDIDFGIPQSDKEVLAISSKTGFLTALYEDGTVTVLEDINSGKNNYGICYVPEGLNLFADDPEPYSGPAPAIPQTPEAYADSDLARASARVLSTLGTYSILNMDGTVKVVEDSTSYGKENVPSDLKSVKAIAGGRYHTMALQEDGTVRVWGSYAEEAGEVPEGLSGVKAIAASNYVCLALKEDGTVVAWGSNIYSQCDIPEGLVGVEAISVSHHCLALKEDGTVVAWGRNNNGQCDIPEGLNNVVRIQAVGDNSIALKEDGTIVVWGNNGNGQCDVPEDLCEVVDFHGNGSSTIALKANGTVAVWGQNRSGKRNVPPELHDVAAVYTGTSATIAAKTDGSLVIWGRDTSIDYERLIALTNVLDVDRYPIVIFRDGTLKYIGSIGDDKEAGINEFLEGLNVLSGHYFAIDNVELLDSEGQAITSVPSQGGYRIQAQVANNYAAPTPGLTIIQVRAGAGATSTGGGRVLGCVGLYGEIPVTGSTISSDFTMPAGISGPAYVDVFVWSDWNNMVPRASAHQRLSFSITD